MRTNNQQFDVWGEGEKQMEELVESAPIMEALFLNKTTNSLVSLNVEEPIDMNTYVLLSDIWESEPN